MIHTELTSISPVMASEMLRQNTKNRPFRGTHAKLLAASIARGEWRINGDAIRFAKNGTLLDGQHRLYAISIGSTTVQSMVTTGLDETVFKTIDTGGAKRTTADILSMDGEVNSSCLASISVLRFKWIKSGNPFNGNPLLRPSIEEVYALINSTPSLRRSASATRKLRNSIKMLTPSVLGFCFSVFSESHPEECNSFFDKLESGAGLTKGSPILLLRDRLSTGSTKLSQLNGHYKCALTFKAFRLFLDQAVLKQLRVRVDGEFPEENIFVL